MARRPVLTETLILATRLYDGATQAFQTGRALVLRDGVVADLRAATDADRQNPEAIRAAVAAPGMVDMQINGAADAQFNFAPTPATLARMAAGAREGGTAHILPTFITAPRRDYARALAAVRQAMDGNIEGIAGIHLEGPFLSPARPGIHDPSAIRPLDPEDVALLEREAKDFPGPILLTLAPECQNPADLDRLAEAGIVLFAGHSEARPEHLGRMRGVTHLWNAMPGVTSRTAGIVSETLVRDRLFAGVIADGHHVGADALALSLGAASDRLCLVTDAMLTLAGRTTEFRLHGRRITLSDGRLTGEDGTLAGAHVAMDASVRNIMAMTGLDPLAALRMATVTPARALGCQDRLGRIAVGRPASVSLFDEAFHSVGVVVGRLVTRRR